MEIIMSAPDFQQSSQCAGRKTHQLATTTFQDSVYRYKLTLSSDNITLLNLIKTHTPPRKYRKLLLDEIGSGVGLSRVVREVHKHPEDHKFESQWWQ
jgi:hypothetical protein